MGDKRIYITIASVAPHSLLKFHTLWIFIFVFLSIETIISFANTLRIDIAFISYTRNGDSICDRGVLICIQCGVIRYNGKSYILALFALMGAYLKNIMHCVMVHSAVILSRNATGLPLPINRTHTLSIALSLSSCTDHASPPRLLVVFSFLIPTI